MDRGAGRRGGKFMLFLHDMTCKASIMQKIRHGCVIECTQIYVYQRIECISIIRQHNYLLMSAVN